VVYRQHLLLSQIKTVDQALVENLVLVQLILMVKVGKETEEVFHPLKETVEDLEHTFLH
jgi:hypothetical protein